MPLTRNRHRGFNLIELMFGITVLAILLGIGVPSLTNVIRVNRTTAEANDLLTAIAVTRNEASKRGMPVSICAADGNTCAGATTNNWTTGWLIFTDRTGTAGVLDGGDELLQTSGNVSGGIQVTSGNIGFVRFDNFGRKLNPGAGTDVQFAIQHQQCSGQNRRTLTIIATGRANIQKATCP